MKSCGLKYVARKHPSVFFLQTVGRSMNRVAIQCNAFFSMRFDSRETTKDQRSIEKNEKYNFITEFNPFACAFSRHNCIFGTEIRDWVPLWNFYTNDIDDDFDGDNKVGSHRSSGATLQKCIAHIRTHARIEGHHAERIAFIQNLQSNT